METQRGASSPEPRKDPQQPLKLSHPTDPSKEPSHQPLREEGAGVTVFNSALLHVTERRQPLSSVSSLEVHFDLLDLTELTDMSDQELAEVFGDSDEECLNQSPASHPHTPLSRGGCMRSPSWSCCGGVEPKRDRRHNSDSETSGPIRTPEPKQP